MILDILYKRTKTGAIQQWTIAVYQSTITKYAGQVGGKLTEHVENIPIGKNIGRSNETSPTEQAELEARADWVKKLDEGYKSLKDLQITTTQAI